VKWHRGRVNGVVPWQSCLGYGNVGQNSFDRFSFYEYVPDNWIGIVCPITNTERCFPFHVPTHRDRELTGFIMVEQVKSIDFRARNAKCIEHENDELLPDVLSILDAYIY
jgi:hypothetical protein